MKAPPWKSVRFAYRPVNILWGEAWRKPAPMRIGRGRRHAQGSGIRDEAAWVAVFASDSTGWRQRRIAYSLSNSQYVLSSHPSNNTIQLSITSL